MIPKAVRNPLNLYAGDKVEFVENSYDREYAYTR